MQLVNVENENLIEFYTFWVQCQENVRCLLGLQISEGPESVRQAGRTLSGAIIVNRYCEGLAGAD